MLTGIVQEVAETNAGNEPSQLINSKLKLTPSLCLMQILYDVIGEPQLDEAVQSIMTDVLLNTVVGAAG